jgi:hypothetical protein
MKDIKELLERYYNAETSLEEEEMIEAYFAAKEAKEDPITKALFEDRKLYQQYIPASAPKRINMLRYFAVSVSVAATIAFICFLLYHPDKQADSKREGIAAQILVDQAVSGYITDEQIALEQARKALAYMSTQLNKGTSGISHLHQLENNISKIQNEQL